MYVPPPSLHFLCSKSSIFLTTYPPLNANVICEGSLTTKSRSVSAIFLIPCNNSIIPRTTLYFLANYFWVSPDFQVDVSLVWIVPVKIDSTHQIGLLLRNKHIVIMS